MEISPHTASAFTDNSDLQLYIVCDVSFMPVAQVTSTHPQPGTMEQWDRVPMLTLLSQQETNTTTSDSPGCCLLASNTDPASALKGLLYQPSCFSSGKAFNGQSPRGNHKKFKPPLVSQFPATALLQNTSSGTATV